MDISSFRHQVWIFLLKYYLNFKHKKNGKFIVFGRGDLDYRMDIWSFGLQCGWFDTHFTRIGNYSHSIQSYFRKSGLSRITTRATCLLPQLKEDQRTGENTVFWSLLLKRNASNL